MSSISYQRGLVSELRPGESGHRLEDPPARSERHKDLVCFRAATRMSRHADAERFCIERGYADNAPDFDARVREIEDERELEHEANR